MFALPPCFRAWGAIGGEVSTLPGGSEAPGPGRPVWIGTGEDVADRMGYGRTSERRIFASSSVTTSVSPSRSASSGAPSMNSQTGSSPTCTSPR